MALFSQKHEFSPLPTDDDEQVLSQLGKPRRRPLIQWLHIAAGTMALLALGVLVGNWTASYTPARSSNRWSSCGDNPETARERGCSFDSISFAWQTPECFDKELVAEFESWDSWSFYSDPHFTKAIPSEAAFSGEIKPVYVQWDYHIVHCTFMWRQMHRAYERGFIDSHLGNYNHTLHCQTMILMPPEKSAHATTRANIIYPECLIKKRA